MTMGRVLRTAGLELRGASSAAFTLREADTADPRGGRGSLVASMVLSTPGCEPFSVWAVLLTGPAVDEATAVEFRASGVRVSDACSAAIPWAPDKMGSPWDDVSGWAASLAERSMGHPEAAAREAAAFFAGMVLAAVADAWASSLVRRACAMVPPGRVVELAREACVEQVMEG